MLSVRMGWTSRQWGWKPSRLLWNWSLTSFPLRLHKTNISWSHNGLGTAVLWEHYSKKTWSSFRSLHNCLLILLLSCLKRNLKRCTSFLYKLCKMWSSCSLSCLSIFTNFQKLIGLFCRFFVSSTTSQFNRKCQHACESSVFKSTWTV